MTASPNTPDHPPARRGPAGRIWLWLWLLACTGVALTQPLLIGDPLSRPLPAAATASENRLEHRFAQDSWIVAQRPGHTASHGLHNPGSGDSSEHPLGQDSWPTSPRPAATDWAALAKVRSPGQPRSSNHPARAPPSA